MILLVLATIGFIVFLIKKNQKDKKDVFKKLPGDCPDLKEVKSAFDIEDRNR